VAASDGRVSPSYVPDLVNATLDLLIGGQGGLRHLANEGSVTWAELATTVARLVHLDPALVQAVPTAQLDLPARRPADTTLGSTRGKLLPPLPDALERYLRESDDRWHERAATSAGASRPPG
jgi:dTDP-4-dehydrorhamnose reductase